MVTSFYLPAILLLSLSLSLYIVHMLRLSTVY